MTEQTEGSGPSELELLKQRARLLGVEFSNNIGLDTLRNRVNAKIAEVNGDEAGPVEGTGSAEGSEGDDEIAEVVDTASEGGDAPSFDDDIEEETDTGAEQGEPVNAFDAAAQIAAAKVTAPPTSPIPPVQEAQTQVIQPIKPVTDKFVDPSKNGRTGQPVATKTGRTPSLRQHLYNEQMKLVRLRIQNLDPKKADLNGEVICVANNHLGNVKMFVPYGEVTDDGWHVPYIIYKELARRRFLSIRTIKDPKTKQLVIKKGWAKEFALDILPPLTEGELKSLAVAQAAAGSIDSGSSDLL